MYHDVLCCILVLFVQVLWVLTHTAISYRMLGKVVDTGDQKPLFSLQEQTYLWGFVALEAYCAVLHPFLFGTQLPFLPLLVTSLYSALGISWCWVLLVFQWSQVLPRNARRKKL